MKRSPSPGKPDHVPVRYKTKITQYEFSQKDMIGEVKKAFCHAEKLKLSSVRLLLNGQRLHDKGTIESLSLKETDDVIEAFIEMTGGGKPEKTKKLSSEQEIRNVLEESFEDTFDSESDKEPEHPKDKTNPTEQEDTNKDMGDNFESQIDDCLQADLVKCSIEMEGDCREISSEQYVDNLRKNETFSRKKPLDTKIIQLLDLPNISAVEVGILRNYMEMRSKLEELSENDDKPKVIKRKRKIKQGEVMKVTRNLRRKTEGEESLLEEDARESNTFEDPVDEQQEKTDDSNKDVKDGEPLETPRKLDKNVANQETPKQRNKILNIFGIGTPSPFVKSSKSTEADLKRLSVAVHLWAHKSVGSMKFLLEERLTDKHFYLILEFAGPTSKWKILKDRPACQYKRMWRNAVKGNHYYRGHPATGYETESRLHSPGTQFCPFQHCKPGLMSPFDVDLTVLTPLQKDHEQKERILSNTNRKLFTPEKHTEIETCKASVVGCADESFRETQDPGYPTPKKQELMRQNVALKQELQIMKMTYVNREVSEVSNASKEVLVECKVNGCGKKFRSTFGLSKHHKNEHGNENIDNNEKHECCFCGRSVKYIDQHINMVHKDIRSNNKCQVCQKIIVGDMKKHRGSCNSCPYCPHKEKKKSRLLKHIASCLLRKKVPTSQTEPWDLSSPKKAESREANCGIEEQTIGPIKNLNILTDPSHDDHAKEEHTEDQTDNKSQDDQQNDCSTVPKLITGISSIVPSDRGSDDQMLEQSNRLNQTEANIESDTIAKQKRTKYPFDSEESDETYMSELEENDEVEFTLQRRRVKDNLELELRNVDGMENPEQAGDDEIVSKFRNFMQTKKKQPKKEGEFSKLKQVSTVDMYTNAVKNCLIPAFHRLVKPFDTRWILDCTTPKQCTINGEARRFVNQEEPIYMSSIIVKEALKKIDSYCGESGSERGTLLSATTDFLDFIELEFNNKMSSYGPGPSERLWPYHNGVRKFLKSTGEWKTSNQEKDKAHQSRKVIEQYENPNKDLQILESYKNYITSSERLNNFTKVLGFAADDSPLPSNGEMTELGQIVMGEVVCATGVRPIVVTRLTNGSWGDKMPGFNPRKVTKDDCVVEEEQGGHQIMRRVNPNLPPKDKACEHQAAEKTAICSVQCPNRCDPDGFNILVTWDKTHSTKGSSYLHVTKPLKVLMDCYYLIRSRFFKLRKPSFTQNNDWLSEDETPVFLKSSCAEFKFLDLKHISDAIQVDVTAYDFRRIVCTWALTHENQEIRDAEEEALQHRLQVARDRYLQNKQAKPQHLTQTYAEEENLFPKTIMEEVEKTEAAHIKEMKENDENRAKKRYKNLVTEKETYKKTRLENKPLGPTHRIVESDRIRFKVLVEEVQQSSVETLLTEMKPLQWRRFIVRLICTTGGQKGTELRNLWVKLYKGDLKWGVRDARMRAKQKNWGKNQQPDRNSWIATSIRNSLSTERKRTTKQNYMKLV